jgi:hypothetical protein
LNLSSIQKEMKLRIRREEKISSLVTGILFRRFKLFLSLSFRWRQKKKINKKKIKKIMPIYIF